MELDDGRWTMDHGRWTMDDRRWTIDDGVMEYWNSGIMEDWNDGKMTAVGAKGSSPLVE